MWQSLFPATMKWDCEKCQWVCLAMLRKPPLKSNGFESHGFPTSDSIEMDSIEMDLPSGNLT